MQKPRCETKSAAKPKIAGSEAKTQLHLAPQANWTNRDELVIMSLDGQKQRWDCDMGSDTEIWPVVLVAATVVILFMAMAASSTGSL